MTQPNPIKQSNLPGIALGDWEDTHPVPPGEGPPAHAGSDGKVGGPGGTLLEDSVAFVSSGTGQLPVLMAHTAAELTSALAVCAGAGGGYIWCTPGTYVGNFTIPPNTTVDGVKFGLVTLTQANGANGHVIAGTNFATLTGKSAAAGDFALGAPGAALKNLIVDGNVANNATGKGIALWGQCIALDRVWARNCPNDGIWTEFTQEDSAYPTTEQDPSGHFGIVMTSNNGSGTGGGNGWTMHGPHDSRCDTYIAWDNYGWNFQVDAQVGKWDGGITFRYFNSFFPHNRGSGSAQVLNNGYFAAHDAVFSAGFPGTTGLDLSAACGQCYVVCSVGGHSTGINLRGSNHVIRLKQISNMPAGANSKVINVNGCLGCDVELEGATGDITGPNTCTVLAVTSEGNNNRFRGIVNIGANAVISSGAFASGDDVDVTYFGTGGTGQLRQQGTDTIAHPTATATLPKLTATLLPGGGTQNIGQAGGGVVAIDASTRWQFCLVVNDGAAFTIANPTNQTTFGVLNLVIFNNSGGAMGAITPGGDFKLVGNAFPNPANGKSRGISLQWVPGLGWIELSRTSADV